MPSSHRRQSSDPFRDSPHHSNYDRNGPRSAPLPPPKDDMLSAVRDVVTVKPVTDPVRSKTGRSHTSNSSGTVTPPRTRRSASSDSVPPPVDKSGKPPRPKASKKASMHADIIDRLDFSGVGAAMLHHDGPFDACAPSRNKHKHKAPMMAWGPGDNINDPLTNVPDFSADRRLSPLAQSTLTAMNSYDSPYGPASFFPSSPGTPGSIPKKRVDALAEAWGMAEPEPFEEFFAGGGDRSAASSIKNGKDGHTTPSPRRAKDARDAYREYLDDGPRPSRAQRTRSTLPPPKPISLPGSHPTDAASAPNISSSPDAPEPVSPNSSDNSPRRSRSLISRIRKMRDAPNVPVTYDEEVEPSDSAPESLESGTTPPAPVAPSTRPTHKHQGSFLGRFTRSPGGAGGGGGATVSPISDTSERSATSADFVYVDDNASTQEKDLPAPPGDYFGDTAPSGRGLGRKTSLMKRFKGVRARGATKP